MYVFVLPSFVIEEQYKKLYILRHVNHATNVQLCLMYFIPALPILCTQKTDRIFTKNIYQFCCKNNNEKN
ncbi:hypothetical protein KUTeg_001414 [Tegillarca granosa]|uniref:Uncharacterized protein n=1 Tax=Tegillarca granosa TaxID=220873 RepID=A0ABQ9FV29_TEGGR|nr:hypothetical protein KUTeg_001414 [Tegillarca granosa]